MTQNRIKRDLVYLLKYHVSIGGKLDDDQTVDLYRTWHKLDPDDKTDMEEVERWAIKVARG